MAHITVAHSIITNKPVDLVPSTFESQFNNTCRPTDEVSPCLSDDDEYVFVPGMLVPERDLVSVTQLDYTPVYTLHHTPASKESNADVYTTVNKYDAFKAWFHEEEEMDVDDLDDSYEEFLKWKKWKRR